MRSDAAATAKAATEANEYPKVVARAHRDERAVKLQEYRARNREIEQQFARDLAEEFADDLPTKAQAAIFRKAWEDGHSEGYDRVADEYEELTELVRLARA